MIKGYRRDRGALGARNRILVLPSVVCSGLAATQIASDDAIAVTHQHGCAVVGDDVEHTAEIFSGVAGNPNIAGALVVGLGCETIQGADVARRIALSGQNVRYVGVQAEGGTARTVERGRELVQELRAQADAAVREPADEAKLMLGLDDARAPFTEALRSLAEAAGARLLVAEDGRGAEQHPELAARGAQIIVAWCGTSEGPRGFAVCPVISVSGDAALLDALADDFDIDGTPAPERVAEAVWKMALATFDGQLTAAERRGADDFHLRRLARTM
jgi:altronate dehydratase large subunit